MTKTKIDTDIDSQMHRHLQGFTTLARTFSPEYGPLRSNFWTQNDPDIRDAIDSFERLKIGCGLAARPMEAVIREKSLPKRDSDKELHQMSGVLGRYYTTQFGYPVVYLDPARLNEAGYVNHRSASMLAQQLLIGHEPDLKPMSDWQQSLILTASFLGMGLIFASDGALPPMPEQTDPILASALFLAIKGHDASRIALHYKGELDTAMLDNLTLAVEITAQYQDQINTIRSLAMADKQIQTA